VRLATWMPFEVAVRELGFFWGVSLSEATVRRHAYAAGAAHVAVQAAAVERIERGEQPPGPPGPAVQLVSADGAMVPLVGGQWAEARTLAIGTVGPPRRDPKTGEWDVHASELTYFSRLADAETFSRLATVEFWARGTEHAGVVVAPLDGSEWLQGLLDAHRPDAVRVLDFPHALQHVADAGRATFADPAAGAAWLTEQAHRLKHDDPQRVLEALRALPVEAATDPVAATAAREATLGYLEKRRAQLRYAEFRVLGYPIGSGCVESANKLVVQARLKGPGMHWARPHVDPMLALRTVACSGRWTEAWPRIVAELRDAVAGRRTARRRARRAEPPAPLSRPAPHRASVEPLRRLPPRRAPTIVAGRPTAAHPWKRRALGHPTAAAPTSAKS